MDDDRAFETNPSKNIYEGACSLSNKDHHGKEDKLKGLIVCLTDNRLSARGILCCNGLGYLILKSIEKTEVSKRSMTDVVCDLRFQRRKGRAIHERGYCRQPTI